MRATLVCTGLDERQEVMSLRSWFSELLYYRREMARWKKIAKKISCCAICGCDISHSNSIVFYNEGYPDNSWCLPCGMLMGCWPSKSEKDEQS